MSKTEDLLFTLDVCIRELPEHVHPIHYKRLEEIKEILQQTKETARSGRAE